MTRDSKMRENKQTTQCGDHAAHNNYNEKKKREGAKAQRSEKSKNAPTKTRTYKTKQSVAIGLLKGSHDGHTYFFHLKPTQYSLSPPYTFEDAAIGTQNT
jgi:uncharacterized membrane protein